MEVALDGESDLDVTEVRHALPAIRKTQTAGAGAGAGEVTEGDSPASSVSSGRADNGSSSSSSNNTGNGDDNSGSSTGSGNVPTLVGRETYRQRWNGKISALQGGHTRFQSRQYQMSVDTADALLVHAQRTVEEDTAIERVHDLLLEGRLEEEHE